MPHQKTEIMVVDDEKDLVDTYELWLQNTYEVRKAYSGDKALEKIDEEVDIVLLDRLMPGMSGSEVLDNIREKGYNCRVCMVTAVDPDFDIINMGFDDYLVKPINRDDLKNTVEELEDRTEYNRNTRKLFSLLSKKSVLEQEKTHTVLNKNEEYGQLLDDIDELEEEVQDFMDDMTSEDFKVMMRDLDSEESTSENAET
ncbi:MAG: response regulator [Halobacteria archaeon]